MNFLETVNAWIHSLGGYALHTLVPVILLLVVGIMVIRLVMQLVSKTLEKSKLEKAAHSLIKSIVRIALYLLLILMLASKLGIDVTGVIALASVLTLAVSLAVQNTLSNLMGGLTLLYTKPFASGDFVEIAGQSGTVLEIGLPYTKMATADNKIVYTPNSAVVSAQIINYTVQGTRRVDAVVSASYDSPVEQVLEALRQAGKTATAMDTPAPFAAVKNYGESTIEYTLQVWCKAEDYWTTLFDVNKNIKAVFDDSGVAMSYPHLNVHVEK